MMIFCVRRQKQMLFSYIFAFFSEWQAVVLLVESTIMTIPTLRYYRTADCNVVGVPPPLEEDEELEPRTGVGKMRKWVRRHTLM